MFLDRIEGKPDDEGGLGQRRGRPDAAPLRNSVCQPQPGGKLPRPARQPGQSSGQRAARDPALPARGPRGGHRARLCQGDRRADGLRAAQQCGAAARDDGPLQRLVRPRADDRAWRDRAARCAQAPAVDRLDPHHPRPGRLRPFLRQMGRSAGFGRGPGRGDVPRQYPHPLGADRAGLHLPRRRVSGIAPRQGAGMARSGPVHAGGAGAPGPALDRAGRRDSRRRAAAAAHDRTRRAHATRPGRRG